MKKTTKTEGDGEHGRTLPGSRFELGSRIKAVVDLFSTKAEAARVADISTDQLDRYISGKGEVSLSPVARLAQAKGVRLDWLWSGDDPRQASPAATTLRAESPRAGYAYIPLFDLAAKGGPGGRVVEQELVVDALAFKEDWIRQELHVRPDDLRLIYVEGDSMEPDLRAGDIVLLDHTDTSARREGIYVLRMDGALLVKILQRLPGGVVKVISRNTAYESFTIMAAELEAGNGTAIIGRVVWACRRF